MRVSHAWRGGRAVFDEDDLVSSAGLVPLLALAEQAGLSRLLGEHVRFVDERIRSGAANPVPKLTSIIAGMAAGADSIDDLCDMRLHVVSESVDWRSAGADNVTSGQCPRPVPAVTCVAGDGWVRSSRESPRAPAPSGGHR